MKKHSMVVIVTAALLGCLLVSPLAMQAQRRTMNFWEASVRGKLLGAALLLSIVDAHWAYDPYIGTLDDNEYHDIEVPLRRGVNYALVGVCDDACRNLNMKMYDEDGNYIGQNTGRTATPDLEITPEQTQRFTVRISMKRCDDDPCYFGLGVYNE